MIDLSKDSNYVKRLCGVELRDNAGQLYVFKGIVKSQGAFAGYLAEPDFSKRDQAGPEPRYVRITDTIVLVPVDLFQEFEANLADEKNPRKVIL